MASASEARESMYPGHLPRFENDCTSSPLLVGRFGAASAYPGIRPIGGALGTVGDVLAPGIGSDGGDRMPNDIECPGRTDLADHDRLGQVVIGVHHLLEAARRLDPLPIHGLADRIDICRTGLSHRLRPHSEADEGGL